jgi:aminopeptidase N
MNRIQRILSLGLLICIIFITTGFTDGIFNNFNIQKSVFGAAVQDEPDIPIRQYAPDRLADILHIKIDVTPDFKTRTIAGTTVINFEPIGKPLTELKLDAIDLDVSSVTSSAELAGYSVTDEAIVITFEPPVTVGDETTVTIVYEAEPREGLYFRTPEMGYRQEDMHLFTQGETHTSRHWYPNYDYPNERSTSEVICRVPSDMVVLSNGRLVSEEVDSESGLKVVHWLQNKTHVNYLVTLAAGRFKKIESKYRNIPIAFYTPASQIEYAENSFKDTRDMLEFFEKEIGVPYPWDKYYQVVVQDFPFGGMENTSLTILTDNTLFTGETENIYSSQSLVAHEMAHQWFGDYVTCKDWSHTWLNEGFATYYEDLYDRNKNGRDSFLVNLYNTSKNILSERSEHRPIVFRSYEDTWEQFDYRTYGKAGWVLHMLRIELGEEMFRNCVKTYLERHALSYVVTEDFRSIIEELTGRTFDSFFDQWIYHGRYPDLKISYNWSETDNLAKVSVEQTHEVNENVMLFNFDTKVCFIIDNQAVDRRISVNSKQHDFYFPLPKEPEIVRFDPDYGLLAKIDFDKPTAMLYKQLKNKDDVIGQLLAIDALQKKEDKKTVAKLKEVLNGDSFYAVQARAAAALQEIHTENAFDALAGSLEQKDARVRLQVVSSIGDFYRIQSLELTKRILKDEKNPVISATAIRNLGRYNQKDTQHLLTDYLNSDSFRNRLASAAIDAIRMLDESSFIAPLMKTLSEDEKQFPSRDFSRALDTLARISRNEEDKTEVRNFLIGYVNHPKQTIQAGTLRALGTLEDPKAIPIVETFAVDEPYNEVERSANRALRELRERKQLVPDEIVQMRETIDKLREETETLKDDLKDIKNRLDAKEENTKGNKEDNKENNDE